MFSRSLGTQNLRKNWNSIFFCIFHFFFFALASRSSIFVLWTTGVVGAEAIERCWFHEASCTETFTLKVNEKSMSKSAEWKINWKLFFCRRRKLKIVHKSFRIRPASRWKTWECSGTSQQVRMTQPNLSSWNSSSSPRNFSILFQELLETSANTLKLNHPYCKDFGYFGSYTKCERGESHCGSSYRRVY